MKRVISVVLLLLVTVLTAFGQTASPLGPPKGWVNDYANVIDSGTKARLETLLQKLKNTANIEIAVVTVDTIGDQDIFDYSLAVARGWGIGSKESDQAGLLLLVAIKDRKYFTQVSRHLEGDLPDGLVGQLQRERLVPQFKQGNYSAGIFDTVQAYVATLGQNHGFTIEGIDQREAQGTRARIEEQRRARPSYSPGFSFGQCCILIVIIIVIILVLSAARRSGGGGCLQALLLGSLFNSLGRGGWGGSSGWNGGGFGGGGGGGGFGGFGGGGDFGGGGAGGSW